LYRQERRDTKRGIQRKSAHRKGEKHRRRETGERGRGKEKISVVKRRGGSGERECSVSVLLTSEKRGRKEGLGAVVEKGRGLSKEGRRREGGTFV